MTTGWDKGQILVFFWLFLTLLLSQFAPAYASTAPIPVADYKIFTAAKQALDLGQVAIAKENMEQYFHQNKSRHPFAYEIYGHLLLLTDASTVALEVYQAGVAEYPENINLLQNLAVAYARNDFTIDAASTYLYAYELSAKAKPKLAFSAAVLYSQASKCSLAIELLERLISEGKEAEVNWILLLAQCYLQQENTDRSIALLKTASGQFVANAKIWRLLALSYYRADEVTHAAAAYKIANAIKSGSTLEAKQLGALFVQLGATYSGATMVADRTSGLEDRIVYQLLKIGDLDTALSQAQGLQQQHSTPARQFLIARILVRLERLSEAEKFYVALACKQGKYQTKAQWELVLLSWQVADWDMVHQRLQRLGQLDAKMKSQTTQLIRIVSKIMATEK